ncbi:uncharacterized protein [Mytilus edulis]|uniref:uncharacterized protein isoform X2 n=1 Tax=Mytilus edulis TaxID=6550 RepID=UPI0039F0AB66
MLLLLNQYSRDTCCLSVYQEGMTPLLYAASKGHLEVVQYLISEGSEIESKDKEGRTALHWAAKNGNVEINKWLIEVGRINPLLKTSAGATPYDIAEDAKNIEVMEYLKIVMSKKAAFVHGLPNEPKTHGPIPATIIRMDKNSIRIYMNALKSGAEIKHDLRIIIVGKKGAGKTSLVKNLLKKKRVDHVESTNGIDIHVKRCKIRTADGKWSFETDNVIADVNQRIMRSIITQTMKDECLEHSVKPTFHEEEKTSNQLKYTSEMDRLQAKIKTKDLTDLHESLRNPKTLSATDKLYKKELQELVDSTKHIEKEEYASLSLWDFAGDKEFYNTHQTFFSEEAIYLVVTKLNETDDETNETLKFWFDSIHFYGTKHNDNIEEMKQIRSQELRLEPPIIAIGTHKDMCTGDYKKTLVEQIKHKLGNSAVRQHLRDCRYISNVKDDDVVFEDIRQKIYEIGKSRTCFGKLLPVRFIQLEKHIEEQLQAGTQFLSLCDIQAIAKQIGAITDSAELDVFLRYHHDFGNLIYYKDIPEYIILNPQWLVNVFRSLVTAKTFRDNLIGHKDWDRYEDKGELTQNLLNCLFENLEDFSKCKEHILKIMERFDIIVRPRTIIDGKELVESLYYVPCMIKTIAPKELQEQLKTPLHKSYCLCLKFNFLPPVLINHLIISCIKKYPTSKCLQQDKNSRLALFRHAGLFDIYSCEKLFVAAFQNFIQFQIWIYSECRNSYKDIRNFVLTEIDKIRHETCRSIRIDYEVKMKCESTSYDCFDGMIEPLDNGKTYFCEEHNITHEYIDDWFSEQETTATSKKAESDKDGNNIVDSDILDYMMTRLVILVDDRKRIEQHTTQEQQYKELLNIALERRDPTMVVHALTEGGYERLANKLNDDLKNESSKFSTGDSQNAGFADVPDYKIRLQKNYLKIINTINYNDEENI